MPSNTPEAIKAWFYASDNYGVEFVYPHERAVTLAKRTNQNVLSMKDDMKKNMATSATSASDAGRSLGIAGMTRPSRRFPTHVSTRMRRSSASTAEPQPEWGRAGSWQP